MQSIVLIYLAATLSAGVIAVLTYLSPDFKALSRRWDQLVLFGRLSGPNREAPPQQP